MAKIVGNVVGIPNPQSDWEQNDEKKADYIKNKPNYENIFANALKGTVIGETVTITDVSPIEHEIKVSLLSDNIPLYPYTEWTGIINDDNSIRVQSPNDGAYYYPITKLLLQAGTYRLDVSHTLMSQFGYVGVYVGSYEGGFDIVEPLTYARDYSIFTLTEEKEIWIGCYTAPELYESQIIADIKISLSKGTEIAPDVSNVEIIVSDKDNNETKYYTDANGSVAVKSICPVTVIKSEGFDIEVEYNKDIKKIVEAVEGKVDGVIRKQDGFAKKTYVDEGIAKSKSETNQIVSNALKGTATGEIVTIADVSLVEHEMLVKVTDNIPLYPYDNEYDNISGVPYEVEADGTIHISGVSTEYGSYTCIKEIPLSAGEYKISSIGEDKYHSRVLCTFHYDGVELPIGEEQTFTVKENTTVSIHIFVNTEPNKEYDLRLKPLLFISELSDEKIIVCDADHNNETTYRTDKNGYATVKSLYPTTIISTENGLTFEVEYNKDINKAVEDVEDKVDGVIQKQSETNQIVSNAIKGTATGTSEVTINDVSPVEHEMLIKAVSNNNIPLYPYDTNTDRIAGCEYTITDDGVYEISGVSEGEFDAVLIKTLTLPAGEYTFWAKGYDSNLGVMFVRGVSVGDNIICHFMDDIPGMGYNPTSPVTSTLGDEVISIWFTPTVETGTSYSWNIKPYLSKGAEIAPEASNAEIIVSDENNNKRTYYTDANGYVAVKSLSPNTIVSTEKGLTLGVEYNKDINSVIGNIDTALDAFISQQESIIEIQNALIGGGNK